MARKRGGLAGLYDRNKGLIRTASTIGASLLGGPGAGAAVNAAFRGFDRPGQRGIGFDLGQGAQGAVEGYGIGSMTKSAQSGLGRLFGARGAAAGGGLPAELPGMDMTPRLTPGMTRSSVGGMDLTGGPSMAARPVGSLAAQATRDTDSARSRVKSAASAVGSGLKRAAKAAPEYQKTAEMILGALPSPETAIKEREAAVLEARQALEQQQFDELMRRQRMQEEREALIAQLFSPILQSRLSERNASMPPTSLGGYLRMNDFPDDAMPVTSPRAPAPLRSSVSPVRSSVAPMRSGVSPVSRLR